jgi:LysM repeat protein
MPRGSRSGQKEEKQKTTASSSAAKSQAKSNASKGNYGKMSDKAQNKTVGTSNREANIQGSNAAVDRANRAKAAATVAPPAPKAKAVVPRNNTANVIAGRQARGLSMLEAQNPRLDKNGKVVSAKDAKYLNFMDMIDGGGPGRAGPEFQTKRQAMESKTGGEKSGTLASFLGATPKDSNLAPTGLAKLAYDGGIFGTMAKGIAGGVKNLVKPATYEVQKKDNLSKIAAANNMTLEQLLAKNPGLDPKAYIQPGQQIKIGGLFGGTQTPEQAAASAAMMAQMDRTSNNNSVAAPAPMGVQGVQCPAGQVFNPVTNSCEPAMTDMTQAAQTSMPAGIPGIANPSYDQIMAYRNNPQAFAPLTPNLNSLMRLTGQGVTMAAEGGIMSLVEAEGGNEKTLISDAIAAIESGAEDEAAAVALAKFVQVHGEDALRNLVEKVQSGDYADTRERFANGENGIVNGPGDGSGTDDKVPATIDGKQDVLLTNNEYVLREPTTAALEAALGKGGLDAVNAAEGDAPAVLLRLMNKVQAERQTA